MLCVVCVYEHIPEQSIGRWSLPLDYDHQTSFFSTPVLIETTFRSEPSFFILSPPLLLSLCFSRFFPSHFLSFRLLMFIFFSLIVSLIFFLPFPSVYSFLRSFSFSLSPFSSYSCFFLLFFSLLLFGCLD